MASKNNIQNNTTMVRYVIGFTIEYQSFIGGGLVILGLVYEHFMSDFCENMRNMRWTYTCKTCNEK